MKQLLKLTTRISVWILLISILGCSDNDTVNLPQVESSFTYTINEDTGTVTFINVSKEASTYIWDFGDGTTSKENNPIKTYLKNGTYKVVLVATNRAGASGTYEADITISIKKIATLPITFDEDDVIYNVVAFEGAAFQIVENPDVSGSNDKATNVGELTNGGKAFEGVFIDLGSPIDLTTKKSISMNFWSEAAIDVLLKLEEGTAASLEATAKHEGGGWKEIVFDYNSSESYVRLTLFADGPGTTAGIFYFDDIAQVEGK
jgi:PKD repeat protein